MRQAGKTTQARPPVKIADNLGHAEGGKQRVAFPHQGIDAPVADQIGQRAAHHVATTHNKQSLHRTIIAWPTKSP